MSVHNASPGDIYTDEQGKLWRVIAICHQPTVEAEEVEGTLWDPNVPPPQFNPIGGVIGHLGNLAARATINKRRVSGSTSGLMWKGWKRIWRKEKPAP